MRCAGALPSLTLAIDRKAAIKRYAGCTISALTWIARRRLREGQHGHQGNHRGDRTIDEALKIFTIPSYRCTNATFTVNGTTFDIASASLKIDNALESAPRTYASGLYAGQPQHGKRAVTINFEIPYSTEVETLKSSYLTSEENASVELTSHPLSQGTASPSPSRMWPSARWMRMSGEWAYSALPLRARPQCGHRRAHHHRDHRQDSNTHTEDKNHVHQDKTL